METIKTIITSGGAFGVLVGDVSPLIDALDLNCGCADFPDWSGRRLNPRQRLFVDCFTDLEGPAFGNATAAARLSGYRGDRK